MLAMVDGCLVLGCNHDGSWLLLLFCLDGALYVCSDRHRYGYGLTPGIGAVGVGMNGYLHLFMVSTMLVLLVVPRSGLTGSR